MARESRGTAYTRSTRTAGAAGRLQSIVNTSRSGPAASPRLPDGAAVSAKVIPLENIAWSRPGRVDRGPLPRAERAQLAKVANSVFYGVPEDIIAEVCRVSIRTARAYKAGVRKPSPQVTRLMQLYNAGRILGDEWIGWRVRDGMLYSVEQPHGVGPEWLRFHGALCDLMRTWAAGDEARQAELATVYRLLAGVA